jgi:hypothetical protein
MFSIVCEKCPSKEVSRSQWLEHLLWLRTILQGGCGIDMDDLDLNTWHDLGALSAELNKGQMKNV